MFTSRCRLIICACCLLCSAVPAAAAPERRAPPPAAIWWRNAVIYEIYPRSFQDSDGDGIGDLNGITQRVDYLAELGVDAIWIAPMFPSPQVDFGYDIANYTAVDPQYGTLADFDHLLKEASRRNIRVILDMVLNHTSDQHPWFQESARSRTNAKADWYVWNAGVAADSAGVTAYQRRFAHDGRVPPNNWESLFGGSAWEWVPARGQFYYHRFYKQQPDLNWSNPQVEQAMFRAMQFWLDRGVAGFRLDAIPSLFEDPQLRDEPETGGTNAQGDPNLENIYTDNLQSAHGVIRRLRAMMDHYAGHRVLIGETYLPRTVDLDAWYGGAAHDELHLAMDMLVGFGPGAKLDARYFRRYLSEVQTQIHDSQPLLVFDNHDNVRSIDRFGDGMHDTHIAKLIATILYTTRATVLTYYGAEIGMHTTRPTRREDVKDPIGITGWPQEKGRDGERTPMQWSAGPQAGFSVNPATWLPVPPAHAAINVETERADPDSLLEWSKTLIALKHANRSLRDGGTTMLNVDEGAVLAYARGAPHGPSSVVVAMNMSDRPQTVTLEWPQAAPHGLRVQTLAATDPSLRAITSLSRVTLPPFAAWIGEVRR